MEEEGIDFMWFSFLWLEEVSVGIAERFTIGYKYTQTVGIQATEGKTKSFPFDELLETIPITVWPIYVTYEQVAPILSLLSQASTSLYGTLCTIHPGNYQILEV